MRVNLRIWLVIPFWLLLSACSEWSAPKWDRAVNWDIEVVAPAHYEVWVSKFIIESVSEDIGWSAPIGTLGCCWKAPRGKSAEWYAMPEQFIVQWFSFAEETSYLALIELEDPEGLFEKMQEPAPYTWRGEERNMPRYNLVLGLAPGGQVVMWIMNQKETAIEVGRYQAQEIPRPSGYHKEIADEYRREHGAYLEEHGLQLDKW
ncbi:DUF2931 family protein [Marinobacter lacisalsi]|uniref:DUF2931 family protein n=1 Tax=Marinobacter lacisalsi TaxID=475979 RepID=A0ABV8QC94_9GAMM